MTALFFRPVATYPVRCSAPAFIARPSYPTVHDVAPLFSLFDESLAQLERSQRQARRQLKRPFNPKFDVKETKEAYSVEGELPGFDAKNISIEFLDDGHTLQIKGKTVKETKSQQPDAVENSQPEAPNPVEAASAVEQRSETSSVKSRQATVEDDVEEQPANASAVTEHNQPQSEQVVAESSSKPSEEQKVTQKPQEQQDSKQHVSERYTGSFTRSFRFPSKINQEAVKASLKDGILAITLPFAPKPESRTIQIE